MPEAGLNDFGGSIDPGQMRWLEATLKKNQKKTIIVLTHHNLVPWSEGDKTNHNSWGWFMMDNADEVKALLKKYGVKAVFSGHHHISTRYQEMDGTFYFVHPALSTYPMRYTVYDMTPKGLKWEVKDVPAARGGLGTGQEELPRRQMVAGTRSPGYARKETRNTCEFYESPSTMKGEVTFKCGSPIQ